MELTKLKKALPAATIGLGLLLMAAAAIGCQPPPPEEPQCTDVTTMRDTIKDVDFESPEVAGEFNDDIAETGQANNCEGYVQVLGSPQDD